MDMDEVEVGMESPDVDVFGESLSKDPWIHRSERMRCDSCMFYMPKQAISPSKLGMEVGRCRRHAPTMNGYPVVFPTDWCGDHKLDENKT